MFSKMAFTTTSRIILCLTFILSCILIVYALILPLWGYHFGPFISLSAGFLGAWASKIGMYSVEYGWFVTLSLLICGVAFILSFIVINGPLGYLGFIIFLLGAAVIASFYSMDSGNL